MPNEHWLRLKELFHQALELRAEPRAAFVSAACADDLRLRRQLEGMLNSADEAATFMETCAAALLTSVDSRMGTVIDGKYRLEELLGEGGMGVVYRATHLALERPCAIKFIQAAEAANPQYRQQFELEAATLGRLRHHGVVSVTDYGVDSSRHGATPYLVMEFLEGTTLAEHCAAVGPIQIGDALPVLQAIAAAIDYAHEQGVLHRDLKPANVFLEQDAAKAQRVKIVDFGLAHFSDATHGRASLMKALPHVSHAGTPAYMAPELVRGEEPSTASDIYAFGVLAFEMLVGRTPFEGSPLDILVAHRESDPPSPSEALSGFPLELDAPLLAPLAKQPRARPARAADVVVNLERMARLVEIRRWRRRERPRRALASVAAGMLVLLSLSFSTIPAIASLDDKLVDWAARWASPRSPDPRILLISLDESSLAVDGTPLTARADEFARTLTRVSRAGARGIAIDLLLPATWSQSPAFSRFVLENADRLTLAALSSTSGTVIGPECIRGLTAATLGPARASNLFAFVNRDVDTDGVTRHGRTGFIDRAGDARDTFASRASDALAAGPTRRERHDVGRFWIDPALDATRFARLSWKDVAEAAVLTPGVFEGRLVLVGGEYLGSGDEHHPVLHRHSSRDAVSGLVLQALLANTIGGAFPVRERGRVPLTCVVAIIAGAVGWLVLWRSSIWPGVFAFVLCVGAALTASFALFGRQRLVVPAGGSLLFASIAVAGLLLLRRMLPPVPVSTREDLWPCAWS